MQVNSLRRFVLNREIGYKVKCFEVSKRLVRQFREAYKWVNV